MTYQVAFAISFEVPALYCQESREVVLVHLALVVPAIRMADKSPEVASGTFLGWLMPSKQGRLV